MRPSSAWMLALMTMALVACGRPNDTHVSAVTPEAINAATSTTEPPSLPVKTDVNAAEAEAAMKNALSTPAQPDKDGPDQSLYVAAQDAAAKAPDTASGDEAKKRVLEGGTGGGGMSASNKPQAAELSKSEEVSAMPKPGQANDHSSDGPAKTSAPEAQRQ